MRNSLNIDAFGDQVYSIKKTWVTSHFVRQIADIVSDFESECETVEPIVLE